MKLRQQETMLDITKEETSEGTKFTMSENNTKVDPKKYIEFVRQTTSQPSLDWPVLASRLSELEVKDNCNVTQLMTAAFGLTAEAGEFAEVVKKIFLQGKPYTEENVFHMKREMGDIMWYMAQACMALDTDFDEILSMNVEKLSARYPEGTFDVQYSENRKEGDV
jgi:NTP pyrophosphatase (non-canonical NTP hydrolase)